MPWHLQLDTSRPIPGLAELCIRGWTLSGLPRFPEAFESEQEHNDRGEKHHQEPAGAQLGTPHIFSVFLYRGQDKENAQCQKNPPDKFQPQLTQSSEEIAENQFELSRHGGYPT